MSPANILIADDDCVLTDMLGEYFAGSELTLKPVHDGHAALWSLSRHLPDLLLLDIGLPGLDGLSVLWQLRRDTQLPVIMLTARGEPADRILGLELGADDYLPKPFNPDELMARIRAVLRRARTSAARDADNARIRQVTERFDLVALGLTQAERKILDTLVRHAGRPVTRDALTEAALGRRPLPTERSLDTHIRNLRRKLEHRYGQDGTARIKSHRNIGYALHDIVQRDRT